MAVRSAPWKRANPHRGGHHKRLSPAQKSKARARARRAGRLYPNLVDNMQVARQSRKKRGPTQARKNTAKAFKDGKDPKGGLTAAGRRTFERNQGSNLKPGVTKPASEMTPEEMRRKGNWAVRFYGRKGRLPALKDKDGSPTRFALTAHAWGEPVPKTVAAARKIAAKGKRLLDRYKKLKAS